MMWVTMEGHGGVEVRGRFNYGKWLKGELYLNEDLKKDREREIDR